MIYQINWQVKPDVRVMVPDLCDHRRQRQGLRRVPSHHSGSQEPLNNIDILYIKINQDVKPDFIMTVLDLLI